MKDRKDTDKYVNVKSIIIALDNLKEYNKVKLDNIERMAKILITREGQTTLGKLHTDDRYWKVRKWLLEDKKFQTTAQFYEWINNCEPRGVIDCCFKATFKRVSLEKIVAIAEETLSQAPILEVKDGPTMQ